MNRTDVLTKLFVTGNSLDATHKQSDALTTEEYEVLNDALNEYRAIVSWLFIRETNPDVALQMGPQTLSDLLDARASIRNRVAV